MIARSAATLIFGLTLCGPYTRAHSHTWLDAHYAILMTGITIGQISWFIDLGPDTYTTSASGKASGALSMLVNGEGRVTTRGTVDQDRLAPTYFSSNVTEDGKAIGLQMTFEAGAVKTLRAEEPDRDKDRIPVTAADRRGVTDPLSAMLMVAPPGENGLLPAHCGRTLAVFDGQRRYNLELSFKRIDTLKIERNYAGPALVCAVVLKPIAGYRADSLLVKYVGGRRDMEIWFAPIAGTSVIAPARLVMPTMIGTLEIAADRFDVTEPKLEPAPAPGRVRP